MNEKTKNLEKVRIRIATMFGIYWTYSILIVKNLNINDFTKDIIGLICLYSLGLSLFVTIIKSIVLGVLHTTHSCTEQ